MALYFKTFISPCEFLCLWIESTPNVIQIVKAAQVFNFFDYQMLLIVSITIFFYLFLLRCSWSLLQFWLFLQGILGAVVVFPWKRKFVGLHHLGRKCWRVQFKCLWLRYLIRCICHFCCKFFSKLCTLFWDLWGSLFLCYALYHD